MHGFLLKNIKFKYILSQLFLPEKCPNFCFWKSDTQCYTGCRATVKLEFSNFGLHFSPPNSTDRWHWCPQIQNLFLLIYFMLIISRILYIYKCFFTTKNETALTIRPHLYLQAPWLRWVLLYHHHKHRKHMDL
jgi:hypothetical protein